MSGADADSSDAKALADAADVPALPADGADGLADSSEVQIADAPTADGDAALPGDAVAEGLADTVLDTDPPAGTDAGVDSTVPADGDDAASDTAFDTAFDTASDATTDLAPDAAPDSAPDPAPDADAGAAGDSAIGAEVDATAQPDGDGDATTDSGGAPCIPISELCDGLDNDCDGATDEDFALKWPQNPPMEVGSPCKAPNCQGVVECKSLVQSICSGCPVGVDLSAQLALPGAKVSPPQATGGFVEVTAAMPLSLLEVDAGGPLKVPVGSSAIAVDADGDGDLDLVWIDGKERVLLMTRTGPWKYAAQLIWPGKSDTPNNLTALTATDADRDGIPEIIAGGGTLLRLVRQSNGTYENKAPEVQLKMPSGQVGIQHLLAADLDGDGNQDLLGSMFHCDSTQPGLRAWLWREGGGYLEAAQTLGLKNKGSPWTCMHSDVDGDGWLDVVVLTESCPPLGGATILKRQPPGIFGSPYQPLSLPPLFTTNNVQTGSPMGGSQADVNGDGVVDYYFSEIALQNYAAMGGKLDPLNLSDPLLLTQNSNFFYVSQPDGKLMVAGLQAGLWAPLSTSKQPMVGWTALWDDLDRDGHLDLVTANGYEYSSWLLADAGGMRPLIWRNNGKQQFADVSLSWGMPDLHATRNLILADLDGDGDNDLVLGGQAVAPRVYRNDLLAPGADLRVRLKGAVSDPWGLGSRLVLKTNQRTLHAEMSVQAVSQGMGVPELHFALRTGEQVLGLDVQWPSGWVSKVAAPLTDLTVTVAEPLLFELSARWSPGGAKPIAVTAYNLDASGKPLAGKANCTIELLPGAQGAWVGDTVCGAGSCTRTWESGGLVPGGVDRIQVQCGAVPLKVRPAIYY